MAMIRTVVNQGAGEDSASCWRGPGAEACHFGIQLIRGTGPPYTSKSTRHSSQSLAARRSRVQKPRGLSYQRPEIGTQDGLSHPC
jgi:hypothetical protein